MMAFNIPWDGQDTLERVASCRNCVYLVNFIRDVPQHNLILALFVSLHSMLGAVQRVTYCGADI